MKLNRFGSLMTIFAMLLISVVSFMMIMKYVALPQTFSFAVSVFLGILFVFLPTLLGFAAKKEETRKYMLNQQCFGSIAFTLIFVLIVYNTFEKNVATANSLQIIIPTLIGGILSKLLHNGLVKYDT